MGELLLHPVVPMFVGAVLVRILPQRVGNVVVIAAPVLALVAAASLPLGTQIEVGFLDWELTILRADTLARPFGLIFCSVAVIAGIYGLATQRGGERAAALITAGAAVGVVYAGDLLTFFLFWELKAIASTFVILARRNRRAGRAGMRYLFVHIAGGKLLLTGMLLHVHQTGSLAFDSFTTGTASTLVLIAVLLSAGMPPLHAWLKDAYPEATVAGTVFLSAFTTKSAVYALARGFPGTQLLIYLGVFMALYGVLYAILANDIRRLLSYHIISQVGYMVAGVGIGTEAALNGAVAHAVAHILYKGLLLMGTGAVLHATGRSKASALGGIAHRLKTPLVLYMIGAASICSVPLFSGFVSKEMIVDAAYGEQLTWLVIALKVVSVGTFLSTGLKLPYATWFGTRGAGPRHNRADAPVKVGPIPRTMVLAMGVAAGLNLLLGLAPDLLYGLLPHTVTFEPYTLAKVVEKIQILAFTGLGFLLLISRFPATDHTVLDTDVVYRQLPQLLRSRFGVQQPVATAATATSRPQGTGLKLITRMFRPSETDPAVPATSTLGAVLLAASLALLASSLLW